MSRSSYAREKALTFLATDWTILLDLYDPTMATEPVRVRFFGQTKEHLPVMQDGDIAVIQQLNVRTKRSAIVEQPLTIAHRTVEQGQERLRRLQGQGQLLRPSRRQAPLRPASDKRVLPSLDRPLHPLPRIRRAPLRSRPRSMGSHV